MKPTKLLHFKFHLKRLVTLTFLTSAVLTAITLLFPQPIINSRTNTAGKFQHHRTLSARNTSERKLLPTPGQVSSMFEHNKLLKPTPAKHVDGPPRNDHVSYGNANEEKNKIFFREFLLFKNTPPSKVKNIKEKEMFRSRRVAILDHPLDGPKVNMHSFIYVINQEKGCQSQYLSNHAGGNGEDEDEKKEEENEDDESYRKLSDKWLKHHRRFDGQQIFEDKKKFRSFKILKINYYPAKSSWWKFNNQTFKHINNKTTNNKNNIHCNKNISSKRFYNDVNNIITIPNRDGNNGINNVDGDNDINNENHNSINIYTSNVSTKQDSTIDSPTVSNFETTTTRDLYAVIYIHSSPQHHTRRRLIRQTWGNNTFHTHSVKIFFILGIPKQSNDAGENLQDVIDLESSVYNDIIQENYIDDYHNLTLKGVGALKWVAEYCSHAEYIIKTDDDILVNTFMLFNYLDSRMLSANTIYCFVWDSMHVWRQGKWRVEPLDYPDEYYPKYCSGSAFIMSTDLAQKLFTVSHYVPFFWVDDVYVTGLLPKKLSNVTHVSINNYYDLSMRYFTVVDYQIQDYAFIHMSDMTLVKLLWKKILLKEIEYVL